MSKCPLTAVSELRLKRNPLRDEDILVVACIRNEMLRLPWFLQYYRRLGADRFLVIDNESDDGSRDYCDSQPDVLVFRAEGRYSESGCGVLWVNEILSEFAIEHWALTVDADELLIYPDCESRNLPRLTRLLDYWGAEALIAPMLDMYPEGVLRAKTYVSGSNFLDHSPLFDVSPYEFVTMNNLRVIARGGPRKRLFWDGQGIEHPAPYLFKIPLAKWRHGLEYKASTHLLNGARTAPISGLLQHFKFLPDFNFRAELEAQRGEHFAGARQYITYAQRLALDPNLSLAFDGSIKYEHSSQSVALGLMIKGPL